MSAKTYTCNICGTQVSKRKSYAYKDGRACSTHAAVVKEREDRELKGQEKKDWDTMRCRLVANCVAYEHKTGKCNKDEYLRTLARTNIPKTDIVMIKKMLPDSLTLDVDKLKFSVIVVEATSVSLTQKQEGVEVFNELEIHDLLNRGATAKMLINAIKFVKSGFMTKEQVISAVLMANTLNLRKYIKEQIHERNK